MKDYIVEIELDCIEFTVKAKTETEAKKKALARLNRKKPSACIKRDYPDNKKCIYVDKKY